MVNAEDHGRLRKPHTSGFVRGLFFGRIFRLLSAFILTASCVTWAEPDNADWSHLRGPNFNGVSAETDLVESFPPNGPPVLWRIQLGQGYSGFIAVGERLYTQTQTLAGQFVVCLDATTGRTLWRRRTGWPWQPESEWPGPRATPTWHDGRIVFADAFGLVGCLNADDGSMVWSVNVTKKYGGRGTEFGYSCTPLVEDGKVIMPVGGEGSAVVALNLADGSLVWRSGSQWASYSSAIPITVNGRRQIAVFLRNSVVGFDPATGRQLWEENWSKGYDEHSSWPLYEEPFLLTASAFQFGSKLLRLRADTESASAELAWQSAELSNDVCSSIVADGHIYGFDLQHMQPNDPDAPAGLLKCIELKEGRVCWSTNRVGHTCVIGTDDKLILFTETGELILARRTPAEYRELGRIRLFNSKPCWTQPSLHRGRLYARDHSLSVCVYLGKAPLDERLARQAQSEAMSTSSDGSGLQNIWRGSSLYAPQLSDLVRWYVFSMTGVFGLAAVVALLVQLAARNNSLPRAVFHLGVLMLGAAGTMVFSLFWGDFVFTWPATLFVVFYAAALASTSSRDAPRKERILSLAVGLGFIALCLVYYVLCRRLFIVMGFGFLIGFVPALPVTLAALRSSRHGSRLLPELFWCAIAFSVYFWASGLFTVWRT